MQSQNASHDQGVSHYTSRDCMQDTVCVNMTGTVGRVRDSSIKVNPLSKSKR